MFSSYFPPVEYADKSGLLVFGNSLLPEILIDAYSNGIFPWPIPEIDEIPWFSPPHRAILYLDEFKLSRRNLRYIKKSGFNYSFNTMFEKVIEECSRPINRKGISPNDEYCSWITPEMKKAYTKLHDLGYAHSIEVFLDSNLVGGLYGVSLGKYFAAESMFYRYNNASKAALAALVAHLRSEDGLLIDCEDNSPHIASMGVREISRKKFISILNKEVDKTDILFNKGIFNPDWTFLNLKNHNE